MRVVVLLSVLPAVIGISLLSAPVYGELSAASTGRQVMDAVYERHQQYPYVYEEQSMVLIDRQGQRETRTLRRYSRAEATGDVNFLLLFDSPGEVEGVAMLAKREADGTVSQSVYLPAFGGSFVKSGGECNVACGDNFLGTDFTIESLTGEVLDDYEHVRQTDLYMGDVEYYVVDVHLPDEGLPLRRHYVLKDSLYVSRTDHLDDLGRVRKRQTHHDLSPVHGDMWRANMMLMENHQDDHRTVIKIDRRVFSADYVPPQVFTRDWLLKNQPPLLRDEEFMEDEEVAP
ncbi:MAG TPA: hypothetical protein DCM54_03220 [Gammaproteobacteria bacterium]|nr:hypothetical protein [Gammaproteobacteria bacterium]|tara:strand:- start:655 stop:1515 length:861 start_codon:yes stop_codon:yes gene_type:complete